MIIVTAKNRFECDGEEGVLLLHTWRISTLWISPRISYPSLIPAPNPHASQRSFGLYAVGGRREEAR